MEGSYRLVLVPVDDDGTISASFLEEAKGAALPVSKERPIDVTAARSLLLSELATVEGVRQRLRRLAEVLPVAADQDAMFDDRVPSDPATFMLGTIEDAVGDALPSALAPLQRAATATQDELRRDFVERHGRYHQEQARRLGRDR